MEELVLRLAAANPGVSEEEIRNYAQQRWGDRQYPTSFRSPLTSDSATEGPLRLTSRCHCGQCRLDWRPEAAASPAAVARCHCARCRHFHASAFGAYLLAGQQDFQPGGLRLVPDACSVLGGMERIMCGKCFAKLGARILEGEHAGEVLLCLGSLEDEALPNRLALAWQDTFQDWSPDSAVRWWQAVPTPCEGRRSLVVRGGCSCKKCTFEALLLPGEAQHCYCKLCRRMSGAAAQTWVPAAKEDFTWTSGAPELMRTTRHGQRHFCSHCGTCLTIVYDSQPDHIWPAAGTLDDAEVLQKDVWYRVIHICCSMMQNWYRLPDDRLPRLKYAG